MATIPNPGSNSATELNCCCPVEDNYHGLGYGGQPGVFVFNEHCPLHGCKKEDKPMKVYSIKETIKERSIRTYEVEATSEYEAMNLVESGKVEPIDTIYQTIDQEITDVEELDLTF